MRTQLRIVAGSLKGRKLNCTVTPVLRPTPEMVREALFSILGNAVPGRPFFDVFAGTGVVGMEALSRGASSIAFVERDFRLIAELEQHIKAFDVADRARIIRTDVYRWAERFEPPAEPITVFFSPPFADYERKLKELLAVVEAIQSRVGPDSVLVLQSECTAPRGGSGDLPTPLPQLPDRGNWDERRYGRNYLLFWVKEPPSETSLSGV